MRRIISIFIALAIFSTTSVAAEKQLVRIFSLDNYPQQVNHWLNEKNFDLDKPLLAKEIQQQHFSLFKAHYVGELSPWDKQHVVKNLFPSAAPNRLFQSENSIIKEYADSAKNCKQGAFTQKDCQFGENFRLHDKAWLDPIANNMNLDKLVSQAYASDRRAILVDNAALRALPTADVSLKGFKIPGEGYPFDNLQETAEWAGTPVYILHYSLDKSWSLVMTPNAVGWIKSQAIAKATPQFISNWRHLVNRSLVGLSENNVAVENQYGKVLFNGFIGAVFSSARKDSSDRLWVPVADEQGNATTTLVRIKKGQGVLMPFTATARHFSTLLEQNIARPYGWGGIYFWHDCSQELKSLFTPLGIWLPRHSSNQVEDGEFVDLSAKKQQQRLDYLRNEAKPLLSIVYIGGHVFLYIGTFDNQVMTYQNIWGLSPKDRSYRQVIGKSVFLPLLKSYKENPQLVSLASKKTFEVRSLDQLDQQSTKQMLRLFHQAK